MADYDRELIACMLDEYERHTACGMDLAHLESSIAQQARLLREADNADAAGVHTATQPPAVGVDVSALRALISEWKKYAQESMGTQMYAALALSDCAEELEAALRTGGGA